MSSSNIALAIPNVTTVAFHWVLYIFTLDFVPVYFFSKSFKDVLKGGQRLFSFLLWKRAFNGQNCT
ncbi:hypothetical protein Bgr_00830 [Bartonella grahamii as4aup]|uniref:Uncharacterized protein n=1 Tax=Bartonella grahamii (strain as4aup) TaxID=634504 RepID=C6ABA2_BARGA|nr:hypothetical protein Bgr_00830 [Bartonella grahamii as4aup]